MARGTDNRAILIMGAVLSLHYLFRRIIPELKAKRRQDQQDSLNTEGFNNSQSLNSSSNSGGEPKHVAPPAFQEATYLINLRRRPDRLALFRRDYSKSDIPHDFKLIDAVDGSKLNIERQQLTELAKAELQQLEKTGYRTRHYQLTRGAIGCYLSHIRVWQQALKDEKDVVLIFEDDAKIPADFQEQVNTKMKNAPSDWDIILLGVACHTCQGIRTRPGFLRVKKFWLLHSYIIRGSAIQKIFKSDALFPIAQQIDSLLSEMGEILKIYATTPVISDQRASRTDIQAAMDPNSTNTLARVPLPNNSNTAQSITTKIMGGLLPTTYSKNGGNAGLPKPIDLNREENEEEEEDEYEPEVLENPNEVVSNLV